MFAMSSSDVRKDWSEVMDSVIRKRPAFIRRTRDHMMLCTTSMISDIVKELKFEVDQFSEDDGSVTLSLGALELIANGKDISSAKGALVQEIMEYAEEYYNEFDIYSKAPNRKNHLPYIMKALTAESSKELEDAVICHDGKI